VCDGAHAVVLAIGGAEIFQWLPENQASKIITPEHSLEIVVRKRFEVFANDYGYHSTLKFYQQLSLKTNQTYVTKSNVNSQ
jgi:hypothetical protein